MSLLNGTTASASSFQVGGGSTWLNHSFSVSFKLLGAVLAEALTESSKSISQQNPMLSHSLANGSSSMKAFGNFSFPYYKITIISECVKTSSNEITVTLIVQVYYVHHYMVYIMLPCWAVEADGDLSCPLLSCFPPFVFETAARQVYNYRLYNAHSEHMQSW